MKVVLKTSHFGENGRRLLDFTWNTIIYTDTSVVNLHSNILDTLQLLVQLSSFSYSFRRHLTK